MMQHFFILCYEQLLYPFLKLFNKSLPYNPYLGSTTNYVLITTR